MRRVTLFSHRLPGILLVLALLGGCDRKQTAGTDAGGSPASVDPKEAELAALPLGLVVTCTPSPARARTPGKMGHKFAWVYRTGVRSIRGTVTIVEFDAFSWHDGRWVRGNFSGNAFTGRDFADWYDCPGARIEEGQEFADPSNWSAGDVLTPSKARWYYIGVDERGQRVKGEVTIEGLAELEH